MSDFKTIMSKRSTLQLIEILEFQSAEYQAEALNAAQEELKNRMVPNTELEDIHHQLKIKYGIIQPKENHFGQNKKTTDNDDEAIETSYPTIDPFKLKTIDRSILTLSVIFISFWIFSCITHLEQRFRNEYGDFEVIINDSSLSSIITLLIAAYGIYGFFKLEKYGWYLMLLFLFNYILSKILGIFLSLKWIKEQQAIYPSANFDSFLNPTFFFADLISILIGGVILWSLMSQKIKAYFNVEKKESLIAFVIALLMICAHQIPIFLRH